MKKQIKISIPMQYVYPLFNQSCNAAFGGAEVDIYNIATKLAEDKRYFVTIWVADFGQPAIEWYGNVRVEKINRNYMVNPSAFDKIVKYLSLFSKLIFSNTDIYLTKTASEMDGWVAFLGRGLRRKKHVHRLASDKDTDPQFYRSVFGQRYYKLHWFGLQHTDLILAQSKGQKRDLKKNTGLESMVVNNGFHLEGIAPSQKKYILWVSRVDTIKRPELFIELAKLVPEEEFVLIMPTMELPDPDAQTKLDEYARKTIATAEALPNVRYIKYVPFHEIQQYYNDAKLFVNTSLFEGFPNTFIQACIGHTPILSFLVNPGNFIDTYELGHVCNDALQDAASFIRSLDDEKVRKLGSNAATYIAENHNIDTIISTYKEEFERLIAGKK